MNHVAKRVLTGVSFGAVVICAILFAPAAAFLPVVVLLIALAIAEFAALLNRKLPFSSKPLPASVFLLLGGAVIAGGLWSLVRIVALPNHGNVWLLYFVSITKFSDVGGFAFGLTSAKLMKGGNHKLCPSISPGKSWEGLFGSLLVSSGVSCAFMAFTKFSWAWSVVFGVVAALVGTFGDLVESKFKRWVGVKDSSAFKFTNGMGGILDMLDSLLFAPAVLLLLYHFLLSR